PTTAIYPLSLHDALPISAAADLARLDVQESLVALDPHPDRGVLLPAVHRADVVEIALRHRQHGVRGLAPAFAGHQELALDLQGQDRKSTRLNSSHVKISY